MYTNISDEFKQIVSSNAVTAVAKIVFTSPNITISGKATGSVKSSIQDVQITDNCYDSGKLIGTAMTKEVEIKVINKDNLDLADKEFELFVGVKLSNGEYEYIPYGKYIITTYEDTKSNNIFKIIAYDYMFKLNKELKEINFNPSFPISLKNFREQLLTSCGIGYKEQQLANDNFIVNVMPNFDGISVRNVLGKIAELQGTFAKINRNNKMQFYLKTETSEQIGKMSMNSKLEINKRFGPVNSVALALKNVEGENVTKRNEQSIVENGETMITITDNPFVYTEGLRESAITELFNALDGFSYYPTKFNYKARLYTDCGDGIEVENVQTGNFVSSIILNQHIKIPATRQSSLENPALSNTAIQNQYISQSKQENTHTELLVDKQNQKIESIVSQVGEQNSKISQVTQTVDELNSKIGEVADVTITGESYNAQVFLEGINASEPILIKIRPYLQSIRALYPSKSTFPGEKTFPRGKPKLIFFDRDNNNMWTYMLPDDLNYINENTYDEFLLDYENQICSVTKRVGIDENGALYKLDMPYSTQYDYPTIVLEDGNYSVYLDTYNNGYLFVKLMSANIYTSQFATKVELNSEIKQTKSEIDLSVSEKLTGYPTTTEMNSAINVKANEINSKVEKKVDEEELGTQITQNWESVQIAWNQISEFIKYINAEMQILDGNKNRLMVLNKLGQNLYNLDKLIGRIGTNYLSGYENIKSIEFDLDAEGSFMTWASRNSTDESAYKMKWSYIKDGVPAYQGNEGLHAGADVYLHGYKMDFGDYLEFNGTNVFSTKNDAILVFDMVTGRIEFSREGGIYCEGNIYADNFTSDGRLKKDIKETEIDAKQIISKILIREFTWKKDNKNVKAGFIAQELEEIDENFVDKRPIYNEDKEIIDYQYYVNDRPILATLVKLVQEQQEEIDNLKEDVSMLKEMLNVKSKKKEKKHKKDKKEPKQYEGKILKTKLKKAKPTQFIEKRSKDGIIIERLEEK